MESLQMGNDRDTASSQSMQAFGEGYIPAMAEFYADKMAIGGTLAGFATKGGKVLSKAVRGAVANGVVSGQMEGAVEAWQTMVQDRALGKEDALNARIYDPTSWSDNMADAYGQAVGPAMLLGGIGGARAGISSAMNKSNPDVKVTPEVAEQPVSIEGDITPVTDSITSIEEGVAPIEGEIFSAPVADWAVWTLQAHDKACMMKCVIRLFGITQKAQILSRLNHRLQMIRLKTSLVFGIIPLQKKSKT